MRAGGLRCWSAIGLGAGTLMLLGPASVPAAPVDADFLLFVTAGTTVQAQIIANGGTREIQTLNFKAGMLIDNNGGGEASAQVRFALPEGLRFGADVPDPTESCTGTATTAECQTPLTIGTEPSRRTVGWSWDIVAARAGSYLLVAEIIQTSTPDPDLSSNTASGTVVLTETASAAPLVVSAGAVRLSSARPKAGSPVTARVRVAQGAVPVRPSRVGCRGSVGSVKLTGRPAAALGRASCTYRPPKTAKGKRLRGIIAFTAQGQRFTRRFSTTLR